MKNRPIKLLVDALNSLYLASNISKKRAIRYGIFGSALQGGEISLSGGVSSQYISALLMVAPSWRMGLPFIWKEAISRPYILLTLQLMEQFGVKASWTGQTIKVVLSEYKPIPFTV